ncbi:DUF2306 domain-containing protein [uncultured Roseobacter sp.]|uniref:DUF2306 domain-containing protein n=1 Tax=uncultured Roseobacter sp. TaxID=114847 RepID=UPI00260EEA67|nr:DUF2306 domain-containing protein [uncultured Roseobacter sp.]
MPGDRKRIAVESFGGVVLILLMLPFIQYALLAGAEGMAGSDQADNRFFSADHRMSNLAIFGHMVLGALLAAFIPLQLFSRKRWPLMHRWLGRVLCFAALLTSVGGLAFIVIRGTIGGVAMDVGFGVYGLLLALCAVQALRHARAGRYGAHRHWALRLFVLSLGSWLYRVHYGVWYALTGGAASTAAFDGPFDLVQNVAFYLPYLMALEIWLRRRGHRP